MRDDARRSLEALRLGEIVPAAFVDDGVTEALERSLNPQALAEVSGLTVAGLKRILLSPAGAGWIRRYRSGLRSEVIAAVVKVMTDAELSIVARAIFNPLPGDGTAIGSPQHFGSRIQPNSPGDDDDEILLSILEGLTYGCGDVIIGLNPASDDVETIVHLEELLRTRRRAPAAADALLRALGHRQADTRARARARSTSASRAWPARRRRSPAWSASTSTAFSTSRADSPAATSRPDRDRRSPTAPRKASTW